MARVAAGSHTITFEGIDTAGGDNTAFIDDVQIQTAFPVLGQTVEIAGAPTGTAWTYANAASGVSANASTFTYMADAPEGGQVGFIYGGGELEQSASGWSAGTYSISFFAAQRYGNSQDFEVKVDGTVVDTIQPPTDQYTKFTLTFAVAAGSHTIAFQGLDTAGGGNTAMIDQVRVVRLLDAAVPGRVTSFTYVDDGGVRDVTDPRGIVTRSSRDLLGRTTSTTEAYVDGTPSDGDDRITLYTYDGDDHVLTMTANLPSGQNDQTTEYIYGVTTGGGSGLNSNDLLKEIRYPDKSAGTAGTSSSDKKQYLYNAVGDVTQLTDQNGSVHAFAYDVLGRHTADAVTTAGSGVDSAVLRLETAYNTQGLAYLFTSYDAASSGTVVNQVQDEFNGLGQLTTEYQSHSGAVNTSTTPKVQYAYTEMASGANHSRLKSMTYVNGRILRYEYASGLDTSISRISFLADDSSGSVGTHLEEYSYLGLSTIIRMARPEPGTEMTYIGGTPADAGDQYVGLDRFGQVADQRWMTTSGSTDLDRFQYAYDRDGNPLYKKNTVDTTKSELYHANSSTSGDDQSGYDKLNRLTGFSRGTLTASGNNGVSGAGLDTISTGNLSALTGATRTWTLDALGNQTATSTDGTSTSRTHDSRNEVTGVGSNTLTFDNAGDMTKDETGKKFTFDAWNHLVGLDANADGDVTDTGDSSYRYDPLGRRILGTPVSGTATDLYYDASWQELEQRQSGVTKQQNIWGLSYVDDLVLRDRDADNSSGTGSYGKSSSGLEERLYAQHDANHNVTSIRNASGTVQQRWVFGPYGQFSVMTSSWTTTTDAYAFMRLRQGLAYLPELGMFDNRMRFYSPNLGRFAQADPRGYIEGLNHYQFARSSPIGRVDPRGTASRWDLGAVFSKDAWKGLLQIHEDESVNLAAAMVVNDRTNGVGDAVISRVTRHRVQSVGGYTFDCDERQNASTVATVIIKTDLVLIAAVKFGLPGGDDGSQQCDNCFVAGTDVLLGDGKTEEDIEDVHVGQRVATDGGVANSADGKTKAKDPNATEIDPKTWRLVNLEIDARTADGGIDVMQVQELMPLATLKAEHAKPGAHISVPLDLGDINEAGEGAIVQSIEPCPTIASGPGRVVLTTITHFNDFGFHLTLADTEGNTETLGITGFHKLYSEDRGWISASALHAGEHIRGDHGDLTVLSLRRDPGMHRVYNMTVEVDHVYYVGDLAALSHNIDFCEQDEPSDGQPPDGETIAKAIRDGNQAIRELTDMLNSPTTTQAQANKIIDAIQEITDSLDEFGGERN